MWTIDIHPKENNSLRLCTKILFKINFKKIIHGNPEALRIIAKSLAFSVRSENFLHLSERGTKI